MYFLRGSEYYTCIVMVFFLSLSSKCCCEVLSSVSGCGSFGGIIGVPILSIRDISTNLERTIENESVSIVNMSE